MPRNIPITCNSINQTGLVGKVCTDQNPPKKLWKTYVWLKNQEIHEGIYNLKMTDHKNMIYRRKDSRSSGTNDPIAKRGRQTDKEAIEASRDNGM